MDMHWKSVEKQIWAAAAKTLVGDEKKLEELKYFLQVREYEHRYNTTRHGSALFTEFVHNNPHWPWRLICSVYGPLVCKTRTVLIPRQKTNP